jgi:hypothetical protein
MTSRSLLALIRARRPRAALFTTYTLSLSFFESVFLPALRQVGCRDISILVDAQEGAASVDEAQARHAGRSYWVAPVLAPGGGIFHPKLAYLSCDEDDLLVVGSGNLTLPGQSNQLECLDGVLSSEHPMLFDQAATFMRQLATQVQRTSPRASGLLTDCAVRASKSASIAPASSQTKPRTTSLIHTLEQSALEAFEAMWTERDETALTLTVLSPFHAPDGGPMLRLAQAVGAKELSIGLDPRSLVAPFDQGRLPVKPVPRYVSPVAGPTSRPLHAKVFEIRGANQTLVISGSVNATRQSLESTKNIEVSLARWCDASPFVWEEAQPSSFEPNRFERPPGDKRRAFLDAMLEDGRVVGCISSGADIPTEVFARLVRMEENVFEAASPVRIALDGTFSFGPVPELPTDEAVQLVLRSETLVADCWLNVVDDLTATDAERQERRAVNRILRGDFDEEDVAQLFQLLSSVAADFESEDRPQQLTAQQEEQAEQLEEHTEFTFQQWQNSGKGFRSSVHHWVRDAHALKAFLRWLNADVLGKASSIASPDVGTHEVGLFSSLATQQPDEQREPEYDLQSMLSQLIQAIPQVMAAQADAECSATLATIAGAHALKLTLTSNLPVTEALSPVLRWLSEYSKFTYAEHGRCTLVEVAIGIAMVAGAVCKAAQASVPAALLRESVDSFCAKAGMNGEFLELSKSALEGDVFIRVDSSLRDMARGVANEMEATETLDERLLQLVEKSAVAGTMADESDEAMFKGVFAALRQQRQWQQQAAVLQPNYAVLTLERQLAGCPHSNCSKQLPPETVRALKARHAAICPNSFCGRAIFYLEDKQVAKAVRESLNHV